MPESPTPYAQTIVQLHRELHAQGRPLADLCLVRDAYELAAVLFTTQRQASGKSFMAHVVGTASILARLNLPGEVVAAGLLHNAYRIGDFGDGADGLSGTRRTRLRRAVGTDVERYVARFVTLEWNAGAIVEYRAHLAELDPVDRQVLRLRIADLLEHLDDGSPPPGGGSERFVDLGPTGAALAAELGHPRVATAILHALAALRAPAVPAGAASSAYPRLCTPRSYRRRRLLALARTPGLRWLLRA